MSRPVARSRLRPLAWMLALALLLLPCAPAAALALPWRSGPERAAPAASTPRGGLPLQEVSPPEPVRQIQAALAQRQPVVEILSPRDDSVLDGSPWTLKLRVHDWPLVDAGPLGLGPHVVVQIDQEPPLHWSRSEGTLPPLSPGSHRLSVYAAMPWGEALPNPGAWQQIRLHRTAPNPLALPARGSPQLLAVSPPPQAGAEPLLLDWLLLDAPLQNLRGSGEAWRLRVSINGDDFLLDRQTPLWLQGWRPGVNALRLELLDGHGDPLNPPFNSLVQEVDRSRTAPRPRWLDGRLSADELAVLLGRAPALQPAATDATGSNETGSDETASETNAADPVVTDQIASDQAASDAAASEQPDTHRAGNNPTGSAASATEPSDTAPSTADASVTAPSAAAASGDEARVNNANAGTEAGLRAAARRDGATDDARDDAMEQTSTPAAAEANAAPAERAAAPQPSTAAPGGPSAGEPEVSGGAGPGPWPPEGSPAAGPPAEMTSEDENSSVEGSPAPASASQVPTAAAQATVTDAVPQASGAIPAPGPAGPPPPGPSPQAATATPLDPGERITPTTSLGGRARDLVAADGTLKRPDPSGPLQRLQGWLQR